MPLLSGAESWFQWLENTGLATYISQSSTLYPIVEIVHIIGFATLVGSAFLFDLRLLGMARKLPVKTMLGHFNFWALISLAVILPSGFTLFMVEATALATNPAFRIKLILIALAGLNAAIFHLFTLKSVEKWNTCIAPPAAARLAGILSILLWFSVISCGRMIAYL